MRYSTAIDIPLIIDGQSCVNIIDEIFSSEYYNQIDLIDCSNLLEKLIDLNIDYDLWRLVEQSIISFEVSPKSQYIKSIPSLVSKEKTIDIHTKGLLYILHIESNKQATVFIADVSRVKLDDIAIETIIDHRSRKHLLLVRDKVSFEAFLNSIQPKLCQLKHVHVAKNGPMGHVSPFSAYDKNDQDYAERLLKQAYDDYQGKDIEPKYIYTFDKKNQIFVQFRSDRNREYHGMDIPKKNLPAEFKYLIDKYHQ